ncbi:hypothetical protein EMIT093MI4_190060 [Pseudomonas sp. IT-93MI4]
MPYKDGAFWQASDERHAASRKNRQKRLSLMDMPAMAGQIEIPCGSGLARECGVSVNE